MSPLRAVMAARAQIFWNRLRQGGEGTLPAAVIVAVIVAVALAPPTVGAFLLGRRVALEGGVRAWEAAALSALHTMFVVGLALAGGLFSEGATGRGSFKVFPLSRAHLVAADLLAGVFDLLPLLALCGFGAFALGVSLTRPAAATAAVLLAGGGLATTLALQQLVTVVKHALARRLALGIAAAVLAVLVVDVVPLVVGPAAVAAAARQAGAWVKAASGRLPTQGAYQGLIRAAEGDPLRGTLAQVPALALTAALVAVALWAAAREQEAEEESRAARREARLWHVGRPALAVARLHVTTVLGSTQGRLVFVMPFVASTMLSFLIWMERSRDPGTSVPFLARFVAGPVLLVVLPYLVIGAGDMLLNQFGLDGSGLKTLFVLPISARDILLGKLYGSAAAFAVGAGAGLPPLLLVHRPPAAECVAAFAASGALFLVLAGVGHVVSAALPRPVGAESGAALTPMVILARLVPQMGGVGLLVLVYVLTRGGGPWAVAAGMTGILALVALLYRAALPVFEARLLDFREKLIEQAA